MSAGYYWAERQWDADLNKCYKALMKHLSPKLKIKLRNTQREWLKFRDAELAFIEACIDEHYRMECGQYDGTLSRVCHAMWVMSVTEKRAKEIRKYFMHIFDRYGMEQEDADFVRPPAITVDYKETTLVEGVRKSKWYQTMKKKYGEFLPKK